MESRRTLPKANQHHQDSDDGLMTSMAPKTFVASREPFQLSESTSPIPHKARLSFKQMSAPKSRKATAYINLVCEAIEAIGNEKKGASVQAIKTWILGNHLEIPERFFRTNIKNALLQGLEQGTLARNARSRLATGAVGSFYVTKKADKNKKTGKATKGKAAVQPVEYASDTELTINRDRAMSVRINLSDTELAEVKSLDFETKSKMRGGRSVQFAVDSADESSSEDSEKEEQIKPVVKAKTKKVIKESKAPKKTAPTKPPKKAASSKAKDEKENAPPKPKRNSRNIKNAKKK